MCMFMCVEVNVYLFGGETELSLQVLSTVGSQATQDFLRGPHERTRGN